MILRLSVALMVLTVVVAGCQSQAPSEPVPLKQELAQPASVDVTSRCEQIKDIKLLPHKNEPVSDPAFNALAAAGDQVIPCLIRKISDENLMDDPRQAPRVGKLAVGDVAFFLLVRFGKADFVELLPAEVNKAYASEGVYGYFRLIDENKNREKLQAAAIEWYEEKYGHSLPN